MQVSEFNLSPLPDRAPLHTTRAPKSAETPLLGLTLNQEGEALSEMLKAKDNDGRRICYQQYA